jgi:peptide/nickel transport system substrate-binding protein
VLFDRDNTTPGLARNVAFFRDPEVHGLLVLGQESDDREQREQIYARVQELIGQQAPWVPIAHSRVVVAARSDVTGILLSATSHVHYDRVRRVGP